MQRFSRLLQLYPDPALIAEYVQRHSQVWPKVFQPLHAAGVFDLQIYHDKPQRAMMTKTSDDFTFERKAEADRNNPVSMQWECEMAKYQAADPALDGSRKGQRMEFIFHMKDQIT